ncbi:MAG: metallophosphoesterase [Candidatus Bathyarchaeia archaeon]
MITPLPPFPAALLKSRGTRLMAVADLHIGWEMSLSGKGIHVPTQTPKLLNRLMDLLSEYKADELLVLGDVKHTVAKAEAMEWRDIPDFFSALKKRVQQVFIIRGNHDGNLEPLLPEGISVLPGTGVAFDDVGFFHGHQWPSPALLKCKTLVMGHVHPVVVFRDPAGFRVTRQVWVKAGCDGSKLSEVLLRKHRVKIEGSAEETFYEHYGMKPRASQLFIMPSFNDFLGGKPLNERRSTGSSRAEMVTGPVLRSEAVDMRTAEAYLLDGTLLGTIEQLRILS